MKFFLMLFLPILFCPVLLSAQQKNKIDTVFFENFNEKILNRKVWNVEVTGNTVNDEQQAYIDSGLTVKLVKGKLADGAKNGALKLKAVYHAGFHSPENKKYDFLSGRINTEKKFEFTYGTASARMKMATGAGIWPAFWALGEGEWPGSGEIDIMETVGDPAWVSHALHGPGYFGNTPIAFRAFFPAGMDVTQWHVYTVDWRPDSITFKVDGKITYAVTRAMIEKYGRWAVDNPKFIILNLAIGGGYPNGVNKISKPYFGLSQTSVKKIKAGKASILVDRVLVTK